LKIKVIYNFILTFLVLNFFIGENPFKNIHLTPFRVFLPTFMIIGHGIVFGSSTEKTNTGAFCGSSIHHPNFYKYHVLAQFSRRSPLFDSFIVSRKFIQNQNSQKTFLLLTPS